jgi:hypothetical protein
VRKFDQRGSDWPIEVGAIADAMARRMPSDRIEREIAKVFDAEAYFKRINAEACREALVEMGQPRNHPKKKPDLVALCAERAGKLGWLPRELRTPHYRGPGAEVAQKEAAQ